MEVKDNGKSDSWKMKLIRKKVVLGETLKLHLAVHILVSTCRTMLVSSLNQLKLYTKTDISFSLRCDTTYHYSHI
jgi:hypothetical protein